MPRLAIKSKAAPRAGGSLRLPSVRRVCAGYELRLDKRYQVQVLRSSLPLHLGDVPSQDQCDALADLAQFVKCSGIQFAIFAQQAALGVQFFKFSNGLSQPPLRGDRRYNFPHGLGYFSIGTMAKFHASVLCTCNVHATIRKKKLPPGLSALRGANTLRLGEWIQRSSISSSAIPHMSLRLSYNVVGWRRRSILVQSEKPSGWSKIGGQL